MFALAATAVTTALIAAGAAVIGGLLTLIGTIINSRSKLAELELSHRHQLEDKHLEAAREHIDELYVPLSAALGELTDAFLELRERADAENADVDARERFAGHCDCFTRRVADLHRRGPRRIPDRRPGRPAARFSSVLAPPRTPKRSSAVWSSRHGSR